MYIELVSTLRSSSDARYDSCRYLCYWRALPDCFVLWFICSLPLKIISRETSVCIVFTSKKKMPYLISGYQQTKKKMLNYSLYPFVDMGFWPCLCWKGIDMPTTSMLLFSYTIVRKLLYSSFKLWDYYVFPASLIWYVHVDVGQRFGTTSSEYTARYIVSIMFYLGFLSRFLKLFYIGFLRASSVLKCSISVLLIFIIHAMFSSETFFLACQKVYLLVHEPIFTVFLVCKQSIRRHFSRSLIITKLG